MLNSKYFIIFQLFCFYFVFSQCNLVEFYRWKQITFEGIPIDRDGDEQLIPPEQIPHEQTLFGSVKPFYYQYNNVLKSAVHYNGKFLITIPRRGSGVPSTLNYVPDDLPVGSSPSLRPYPDFETNELHPELKPDENRIVSVYRTRVDVCDRLWFVDTGTLQGHEGNYNKLIQRPSLWVIDLKTDKRIRRFEIPETLVPEGYGMISVRVDVEKDKCDDAYAYIADYLKEKIYVYSFKTNRMWPVSHVYMNDEKKFGIYKVDGVQFEWFDGIFSVALGRKSPSTGYRTAYFHPLSSNSEFQVSTKILRNETLSQDAQAIQPEFVKIGNRGKSGHSLMHEFDDRTSVIFFAMLTRNAITCWNSNTKYLAENQGTIIENDDRFKYPVDLNIDTNGTLWALSNNFVRFSYGKLDTNEYNYRLWRGNPKDLVKNTVCEPRKFKPVNKVTDGGPR
ncbi:L-dopachrome tautomerase yellow-f-like [Bradysia coprophila]|uniref:L-dopachrome tautomerase yellow-f-like n=1 Tax=Bradysia coprophila TaxID=38358 RepID=UPI00187DB7BD|nr:L-dopachrome tautomerase yellow-f-like [Bradysia coprophila]